MIDFDRKPNKSAEEIEFDKLNAEYEAKFGVPYVFSIGVDSASWEETLKDIRDRIKSGTPQPNPDYQPGDLY